jgi:hypothetical protein
MRPVLYLDLDDTLIAWPHGRSGSPRGARGGRELVLWALDHYEVRWLTTWCPDGRMEGGLLRDLAKMLDLPRERLEGIRGVDWSESGRKLDGIAWVEHVVLGRPFVWLEDEHGFGERERRVLGAHGLAASHLPVNVSTDPDALASVHAELRARAAAGGASRHAG